jgi:ribosomal protein S18 acetylase RimI-like enzyme
MAAEHNSPVEVTIREMGLDDLAPVYHLGERLFTRDRYPFLYRTWDEWEVVGHFNTDPELGLVAEADGVLVGFIIGTLITKGGRTYGYILWEGVERDWQSRGVAHRLYDALVELMVAAGARHLIADTEANNTAALRFLAKKGFTEEREHVVLSLDLGHSEQYRGLLEKYGDSAGEEGARKKGGRPKKAAGKSGEKAPRIEKIPSPRS